MARYIGPKCKRCRKAKEKLFLRGDKCLSDKCVLMKRGEEPEVRGRRRMSAYSIQLREKQKLRMMYGILEAQFHNYFLKAAKTRNTAASLVIALERRLDNVVFRLGFAGSRTQARQFVRHGHITVNGRRVSIPSYPVKASQTVGINGPDSLKVIGPILATKEAPGMTWLSVNPERGTGTVVRVPTPEDVKDIPCNTQLIVELYSK
ncbi:30S ribosomal protein S4 [candidate division WOR-3 bacterium]|nr:30S ribosomal protein S4 [candidate division WOR-3 bacterium]